MGEIRRYSEIMKEALARMVAGQDRVTDFNEGSIVYCLLDTFSRLMERAYLGIRQGYNDNLRLIPYAIFGLEKREGMYASGRVRFKRGRREEGVSSIPAGIIVTSSDGKRFVTVESGSIAAGALVSGYIGVRATLSGRSFNLGAGSLTNIESGVPDDVVSVENDEALHGGTDAETDAELEERFLRYINGLSGTNDYAVIEAARTVSGVRSVAIKNHRPALNDIYNVSVYVDSGGGYASAETLEAVRLAVEGDGTASHIGHLAPGINARFAPPEVVNIDFSIRVFCTSAGAPRAEAEARALVQKYMAGFLIGESVARSKVSAVLAALEYTRDVIIDAPEENIAIGAGQIARLRSLTLEVKDDE